MRVARYAALLWTAALAAAAPHVKVLKVAVTNPSSEARTAQNVVVR